MNVTDDQREQAHEELDRLLDGDHPALAAAAAPGAPVGFNPALIFEILRVIPQLWALLAPIFHRTPAPPPASGA